MIREKSKSLKKISIRTLKKGYVGKNTLKSARTRFEKGLLYNYRDRKVRRRIGRKQAILGINIAARQLNIPYSILVSSLLKYNVLLDRQMLYLIALTEPRTFQAVCILKKTLFK